MSYCLMSLNPNHETTFLVWNVAHPTKDGDLCDAKGLGHDNLLPPLSLSDLPRASNNFKALFFSTLKQNQTRLATLYFLKNFKSILAERPPNDDMKLLQGGLFSRERAWKTLFGKKWFNAWSIE